VIRVSSKLTPLQATLRYRDRWMVEDIFRTAKSLLATRPIFHKYDQTIRGHIFCSFLALVLRKELEDRLLAAGHDFEWADIVQDLERLSETEIEQDGKRYILRNAAPGCAGTVLKTLGIALPPLIRCAQPPPPPPPLLDSSPPPLKVDPVPPPLVDNPPINNTNQVALADDPTIKSLTDKLNANPDDANALYRRGQVYASKGAYSLAVKDFDDTMAKFNVPEAERNELFAIVESTKGDIVCG